MSGISDRPHVRQFAHPEDLRRVERDHEDDHRAVAVEKVDIRLKRRRRWYDRCASCGAAINFETVVTRQRSGPCISQGPPAFFQAPIPPSIWRADARPASCAACTAMALRSPKAQ